MPAPGRAALAAVRRLPRRRPRPPPRRYAAVAPGLPPIDQGARTARGLRLEGISHPTADHGVRQNRWPCRPAPALRPVPRATPRPWSSRQHMGLDWPQSLLGRQAHRLLGLLEPPASPRAQRVIAATDMRPGSGGNPSCSATRSPVRNLGSPRRVASPVPWVCQNAHVVIASTSALGGRVLLGDAESVVDEIQAWCSFSVDERLVELDAGEHGVAHVAQRVGRSDRFLQIRDRGRELPCLQTRVPEAEQQLRQGRVAGGASSCARRKSRSAAAMSSLASCSPARAREVTKTSRTPSWRSASPAASARSNALR